MKKEIKHNIDLFVKDILGKTVKKNFKDVIYYTFNSINEFYNYLQNTPVNNFYKNKSVLQSGSTGLYAESFTKTKSYEEAVDLMKYGWTDGAKKITNKLKNLTKINCDELTRKQIYDVVGFNPSVPRYLQGIPTNMINQKLVRSKQKIVTITKSIGFTGNIKAEQIIDESVKCLQIIKKIEQQGIRCNLNVCNVCAGNKDKIFVLKIRAKNSTEKINISKLAFLMAHPSMKRRLVFKFTELFEECDSNWDYYGSSLMKANELKQFAEKNEIMLPSLVDFDVEEVKTLNDLIGK